MHREAINGSKAGVSAGYEPGPEDRGVLEVEYASGGVYQLSPVRESDYTAFVTSPSKGRVLQALRASCTVRKVDA